MLDIYRHLVLYILTNLDMFCVCFVVIVCFFKPLNSNMFYCRNQRFDKHKQNMRNEIDYPMTMILALS